MKEQPMQCSGFETVVHDLNRAGVLDLATREAAIEHAQTCARCAALREAADALTANLYALAMAEQQHEAPKRVEAAVLDSFRASTRRARRVWLAPAWAWSLAAAVLLALGLGAWALRSSRRNETVPAVADEVNVASPAASAAQPTATVPEVKDAAQNQADAETRWAESFVALPYSLPLAGDEDAAVVSVRMPRGALGAFGLPVDEERAAEVIQVEFLLAEDGSPEAVRISP
jgi:hypothetical protein